MPRVSDPFQGSQKSNCHVRTNLGSQKSLFRCMKHRETVGGGFFSYWQRFGMEKSPRQELCALEISGAGFEVHCHISSCLSYFGVGWIWLSSTQTCF